MFHVRVTGERFITKSILASVINDLDCFSLKEGYQFIIKYLKIHNRLGVFVYNPLIIKICL